MFWSSQKKEQAQQKQQAHYALAKKLYLMRLDADPFLTSLARSMGVDPTDYSGEHVFCNKFPEFFVIVLTECYFKDFDSGRPENRIVQTLSAIWGGMGVGPEVPEGTDFLSYLRQVIDTLTRGHAQVSDDVLFRQVEEVKKSYKHSG